MTPTGDDAPTLAALTGGGAAAGDAALLGVIADLVEAQALVFVVVNHDASGVRASWPVDRPGDPATADAGTLLAAAGATGGVTATATAEIDAERRAILHAALVPGCDVPAAEGALGALARLLASHVGAEIARAHADDVRARMASLVDAGLALGQELTLDDLLTRIVQSAREVVGARYAALGVLDAAGHRARRSS